MNRIRIPTTQYGFLEFEFEGTPEQAVEEHNRILLLYNGGFGLEHKDWNAVVDRMLSKGDIESSDTWAALSKEQMWFINEIKKAFKRLEK